MNRNLIIAAVLLAAVGGIAAFLLLRPSSTSNTTTATAAGTLCSAIPEAATLTNEEVTTLRLEDQTVGTGLEAQTGDSVQMHYVGRLVDGTQFDTSCSRGQTFNFTLGQGQVIQGWDSGILGMKVGGKRRLIIPAALGYGASGQGSIPPNAALVFDVELIGVTKPN